LFSVVNYTENERGKQEMNRQIMKKATEFGAYFMN